MSRPYHHPPPPPPPPPPQCIITQDNTSSDSESDDDSIDCLQTVLVPSKNVSIEAHFDEAKTKVLIYLDASVIMDTRLSDNIDSVRTGFYNSYKIHVLVVDKLQGFEKLRPQSNSEGKGDNSFTKVPSAEMLREVKKATMVSLTMGIAYCSDKVDRALPWELKEKKKFLLEKKRLQAIQLHGEECMVLKKGKCVAMGRLSFGAFGGFTVGDNMFHCTGKEIRSGEYRIQSEADTKMTEQEDWEKIRREAVFCSPLIQG